MDGGSLVVGVALAGSPDGPGAGVGIGVLGYLFGAPIVHFAHGRVGPGFGSFGLRIGLPIGGAIVGAIALAGGGHSNSDGALEGLVVGTFLGVVSAITIDAAALAYDRPRPAPTTARLGPVSLTPGVLVTERMKALTVSGTF